MGVEHNRSIEDDLALYRRAAYLLVILQSGLAGGEQKVTSSVVRRHHVQGSGSGIVQSDLVLPLQGLLHLRILQQADLLAAHIPSQGHRLLSAAQQQVDAAGSNHNN